MGNSTYGLGWRTCQALTAPGRPDDRCQDSAHAFRAGDLTVMVVADGVSDAQHPAEASDSAGQFARQVATETRNVGWYTADHVVATMRTMMRETSERFLAWAGRQIAPDGYQTTLALAVAYADWLGIASVGDSFAVVCSGSDAYLAMEPDRPGNPNETYIVHDWETKARYLALYDPKARGVLLSTDGLESLLIHGIVRKGTVMSTVPLAVHADLAAVLVEYCDRQNPSAMEVLRSPDAIRLKGDDVGVSMATRHVGLAGD